MNLPETIAGLEALRDDINTIIEESKLVAFSQYLSRYKGTLDSALAHLRSQEETVRRCAEVIRHEAYLCYKLDEFGKGRERGLLDAAAILLAAHGLEGK